MKEILLSMCLMAMGVAFAAIIAAIIVALIGIVKEFKEIK
jgi:hypothetical protein